MCVKWVSLSLCGLVSLAVCLSVRRSHTQREREGSARAHTIAIRKILRVENFREKKKKKVEESLMLSTSAFECVCLTYSLLK